MKLATYDKTWLKVVWLLFLTLYFEELRIESTPNIFRMEDNGRGRVLCFGEVLWDVYPDGKKLGGAPFNVAAHLHQLGYTTSILSRIGDDELGREIRNAVKDVGVDDRLIQVDEELDTGTVAVELDESGKPTYEIVQPVAWDAIEVPETSIKGFDAMVFGTLASRMKTSRETLKTLIQYDLIKVCDLNLRGDFFQTSLIDNLLSHTKVLKMNDEEQDVISKIYGVDKELVFNYLLTEYHDLELIIMTRGAHGAMAIDQHNAYDHPGYKISVVDTVGSGDSFLAGFLSRYLRGETVEIALDFACRMGAFVATQKGAIPRYESIPQLQLNS